MPLSWAFDERKRRYVLLLCLMFSCVFAFTFSIIAVNASGIGGYISEKVIARAGVANSNLRIDRLGVNNSYLDIGMGPKLSIAAPTSITWDGAGTHATLNGAVTSLNGFPSVTAWFEWGYDGVYDHSTLIQSINAVQTVSATIDHFDPTRLVWYRLAGNADGTVYAPATLNASFLPAASGDGNIQSFNLLYLLLTFVIAMAVIVGVLVRFGTPIKLLMFIIVGISLLLSVVAALNALPK